MLTGGPGCGKSFTVRSVVELARAKKAKVVLAAPTGRAAKRLAELTGAEASTVHRLLELKPGGDAAYDRDRPLDADLVVVDEASMLDLLLANKLVKAVPPGAHLLLVGDVDQLPSRRRGRGAARSAGRGRPGARGAAHPDLPAGPAVRCGDQRPPDQLRAPPDHPGPAGLLPLRRGRHGGGRAAHRRRGGPPHPGASSASTRAGTSRCSRPMHRGPAGAGTLNGLLQQAITPARPDLPEKRFGGRVFRVGDKVTQIRNNYDKGENGVFNGTVGVVTALDPDEQRLTVLHGRGRGGAVRLRRAGRAGPRLRGDHPPLAGQRVSGGGDPGHHRAPG